MSEFSYYQQLRIVVADLNHLGSCTRLAGGAAPPGPVALWIGSVTALPNAIVQEAYSPTINKMSPHMRSIACLPLLEIV